MTLIRRILREPVFNGHPLLSGHLQGSRGCPPNTGLTVVSSYRFYGFANNYLMPCHFIKHGNISHNFLIPEMTLVSVASICKQLLDACQFWQRWQIFTLFLKQTTFNSSRSFYILANIFLTSVIIY